MNDNESSIITQSTVDITQFTVTITQSTVNLGDDLVAKYKILKLKTNKPLYSLSQISNVFNLLILVDKAYL